jgi:phosphoglycerol transferase MdoB-like AlkP superfamily enzyme
MFGAPAFKVILLNSIFLFFMTVYRLILFLSYAKTDYFKESYSNNFFLQLVDLEIIKTFFMGIRFDVSILSAVNSIPVLIFIILFLFFNPVYFKYFFHFLKAYYTVTIGFVGIIFTIDFNFYAYFRDRLNILIYGFLEDDTTALIQTFIQNYNLFLISFLIIFIFLFIFFLSKKMLNLSNYNFKIPSLFTRIAVFVVLPILTFIMIRGTLGNTVLRENSDVSDNLFLNKIAQNCFFTLQEAISHKNNEEKDIDYNYDGGERQAFADFLDKNLNDIPTVNPEKSLIKTVPFNEEIEKLKPNVILVVMESFQENLINYNSAKFNVLGELKKHFDEDIVFHNFFSEETVTISALEALFLNTVIRPNENIYISQSKFLYNKYPFTAMSPYKENGYETIFIYGGNTGWRKCGEFALSADFDKALSGVLDKSNFPQSPWGIYDEYLFDLAFENFIKSNNKKFLFILTTTNHPPYNLPNNYKPLSLEIPDALKPKIQDIKIAKKSFATYQYSNEMLGKFITKIKNSKYANNTIIVVTGDHSSNIYGIRSFFDAKKVPLYIYVPPKLKPKFMDLQIIGSHLDIMSTIYNLSLSNSYYMSQGVNLFSQEALNNSVVFKDYIMNDKYAVRYDFNANKAEFFILNNFKEFEKTEQGKETEKLLKRLLSMAAITDYLLKDTGKKSF